jgi:hypothetical protein
MTIFHDVWLSTDAQFDAVDDAFRVASPLTKLIGRYPIRPGAAWLRPLLTPWMRMPLVYVAAGDLEIGAGKIAFRSVKPHGFAMLRRNLWPDMAFELSAAQIGGVQPSDRKFPVNSAFELVWTRIRATAAAPLDNFLITTGGRNALVMARYREQSLKLRDEITALVQGK